MGCPGIHCPGCGGGPSGLATPVAAIAIGYGVWRGLSAPSFETALNDVLTWAIVGAGLCIAGMILAIARALRPRRVAVPRPRPAALARPQRPAVGAARSARPVAAARPRLALSAAPEPREGGHPVAVGQVVKGGR